MFRSSERNAALELQSCIVCPERFTRSVGQGLKALSGADFAAVVLSGVFKGVRPRRAARRPLLQLCSSGLGGRCRRRAAQELDPARVLPLTPRFFFLGISESTKETLHQLLVGKRQRPAAELRAPVPGLVNFPLSDRLRYSRPGQGLSFFHLSRFF